jgi:amidase
MGVAAATCAAAISPGTQASADVPAGDVATYRTASDLVRALAAREVSSRELTDAAIARIEAVNPRINAVVVRDYERARAAADAADAAGESPVARPADDGEGAVQRPGPADHLGPAGRQGLDAVG